MDVDETKIISPDLKRRRGKTSRGKTSSSGRGKRSRTTDPNYNDEQKFSCDLLDNKWCKNLIKFRRLLESRSACMYRYLLSTMGPGKIFSTYLTLSVLLSFVQPVEAKKMLHNSLYVMYPDADLTTLKSGIEQLIGCNRQWNTKTKSAEKISKRLDIRATYDQPWAVETVRALMFLQQVEGVINKPQFVEESAKYVNLSSGKLSKISDAFDKRCAKHNPNNPTECEEDAKCTLRTTSKGKKVCINSQRYRQLKAGDAKSYYILDDGQTGKFFVYRPMCLANVISGNSGIFLRQEIDRNNKIISGKRDTYTITFPPFGGESVSKATMRGAYAFYYGGYIQDVKLTNGGKVGVQIGMFRYIDQWYKTCFEELGISKKSDIYIVGTSLGGALANLASFYLLEKGYKKIHMYACGAPRVGDYNLNRYMASADLAPDSANYVRFNNVVKGDKFYTEYDPVAKFPPNSWSVTGYTGYGHLRFVDNSRIRGMAAGLTFKPVLGCFTNQPDYDMMPGTFASTISGLNKQTPIGGDCANHWDYVHSLNAYSADVFLNAKAYSGDPEHYMSFFDAVRDLNAYPCKQN